MSKLPDDIQLGFGKASHGRGSQGESSANYQVNNGNSDGHLPRIVPGGADVLVGSQHLFV